MRQLLHFLSLYILSLVFNTQLCAQEIPLPEKIAQQLAHNEQYFRTTELYLHIDKSVYINNENIWFAGYLLKSAVEVQQHHTMYVVLSNSTTKKVVASDKFVMDNGLASGNLFLADSLLAGDYDLIAYTNKFTQQQPAKFFFQQRISIKSSRKDVFNIEFSNPIANSTDTLTVPTKITTAESYDAKSAVVAYQIIANGKKIFETTATTNNYGEVNIKVPLQQQAAQYEWHATIKEAKKSFVTKRDISKLSNRVIINWYPEGGSLVDGLPSKLAFEALTITGKPVALQGKLVSSSKTLIPLQTNTAGLGAVNFRPNIAETYSLVLDDSSYRLHNFTLPTIKPNGYVVQLNNAVPLDTVTMRIYKNKMPEEVWVMVHNYSAAYSYFPLQIKNNVIQFKMPVKELPIGLAFITLLSKEGEPLTERSFFVGHQTIPVLELKLSGTQFNKRSKVSIDIKAMLADKTPVPAIFSSAAVLYKRVDTTNFQHILSYSVLNSYIQNGIIPKSQINKLQNKEELEMFLLTRCWTNFKEIQPENNNLIATPSEKELNTSGYVLLYDKKLKKPVEIGVINKDGFDIISTDSSGNFTIPHEMIATVADNKISLFINGVTGKENYTVVLNKLEEDISNQVSQLHFLQHLLIKAELPKEEKDELNKIPTLTNVVVTGKDKKNEFDYSGNEIVSSTCNDYVCMYNILNCRNHPGGTPAVNGEVYNINGRMVMYRCMNAKQKEQETFVKIKGRYFTKEFYKADYAKFNPPDPEIASTLFWQPATITNANGEALIEFYTNDLPGVYAFMVEGITDNGVLQQQVLFKVNNQ